MAHRIGDLTGKQFGFWTVLRFSHRKDTLSREKMWLCRCVCGTESCVGQAMLVGSRALRCKPCSVKASITTHGMSRTDIYEIWCGIIKRCINPKAQYFKNYGGRGISVCDRWRHSFEAFMSDMGPRPSKNHSIDRINNDGNYEPNNCQWAGRKEQRRNSRQIRLLTFRGVTKPIWEWAEATGIKSCTIRRRVDHFGWTVDEALTVPTRQQTCKSRPSR